MVVQLTDDEKFLFKPELKLEEVGERECCPCTRCCVSCGTRRGEESAKVFFLVDGGI